MFVVAGVLVAIVVLLCAKAVRPAHPLLAALRQRGSRPSKTDVLFALAAVTLLSLLSDVVVQPRIRFSRTDRGRMLSKFSCIYPVCWNLYHRNWLCTNRLLAHQADRAGPQPAC